MIYPKRPFVLINNSGFYFEEIHSNLEDVWKYPQYKELLEKIDELKKSQKVIFLFPTQRKERELLAVYMPVFNAPLIKRKIVEKYLVGANKYNEQEILKLAEGENRYLWLSLFVFLRLGEHCGWNPSYFWTHNPLQVWLSYDLSRINYPLTRKYLDSGEQFSYIYFLELISAELLAQETEESKIILKLLHFPLGQEIEPESLGLPANLDELTNRSNWAGENQLYRVFEQLYREGELFLTGEGKVVRI